MELIRVQEGELGWLANTYGDGGVGGAGCLLYIKSPRVITKINRTVEKQFTPKWRHEPKNPLSQRTIRGWQGS